LLVAAKGLGALGARGRGRALGELEGGRVGVFGAEVDDGGVLEAGAFAEGWGRWVRRRG
jgi:hypothetical protein